MDKYLFLNGQFLPTVLKPSYLSTGQWDESEGVFVGEDVYLEFTAYNPGKVVGVGEDKLPCWIDDTLPTYEGSIESANMHKSELLNKAKNAISIWQTKLILNRLSDEDKIKLNAWLDYIEKLESIDPNSVEDPSTIQWPTAPEA